MAGEHPSVSDPDTNEEYATRAFRDAVLMAIAMRNTQYPSWTWEELFQYHGG